ncbi:carbon-nitrogen hydrolase [Thelephora ganbajun]|uniref:Carbon-nitrogen hydrolase n=1 Tax=Thelephora ganbajun TaxID=370292 RepID=A0ACB6ZJY6_THEGA|nr:carbon-nitrogen hydrolase [Thelephora ganbajun]
MGESTLVSDNTQAGRRTIIASVVQTCSARYSVKNTLKKLEDLVSEGKGRHGSQLMVFPEAFIGGYPKFSTFGTVIGERSPEGREEFLRYHSAAVDIPSPVISSIERISKTYGAFLVVGVIERDHGTLYCTVIFVDPELGYVGKHRKLAPTALERVIWGQGDAKTLSVVQKSFGRVEAQLTAAICWENYMPLLRSYYYSKASGSHIYCAPTVDTRTEWQSTMQHVALEGRCFVLSACQFAQEKDYPADHAVKNPEGRGDVNVMIRGGSVIISPLGKVLAGPMYDQEGILTAELDMDDIVRGKFDLDVAGHYARPDIFQLVVNGAKDG